MPTINQLLNELAEDEEFGFDDEKYDLEEFGATKGRQRRLKRRYRRRASRYRNCLDDLVAGRGKMRPLVAVGVTVGGLGVGALGGPLGLLAAGGLIGKRASSDTVKQKRLRKRGKKCARNYRWLERTWKRMKRRDMDRSGLIAPGKLSERLYAKAGKAATAYIKKGWKPTTAERKRLDSLRADTKKSVSKLSSVSRAAVTRLYPEPRAVSQMLQARIPRPQPVTAFEDHQGTVRTIVRTPSPRAAVPPMSHAPYPTPLQQSYAPAGLSSRQRAVLRKRKREMQMRRQIQMRRQQMQMRRQQMQQRPPQMQMRRPMPQPLAQQPVYRRRPLRAKTAPVPALAPHLNPYYMAPGRA